VERVLIYSHDTYGLGHLRRCLRIAAALVGIGAARNVIIASGSPLARSFALPSGIDIVALPAVTKRADGVYDSLTLGIDLDDIATVRGELVRSLLQSFRPQVFLVDHSPAGMGGELGPVLDELAAYRHRTRVVLGMREIVDEAGKVDSEWTKSGVWDQLRQSYDAVIVYGDPVVKTTALELGMAARLSVPVEHVGYVAPPSIDLRPRRRRLPTVVVTVGGGADGFGVLDTYVRFLTSSPLAREVRSVLVTGPFFPDSPLGRACDRLARLPVEMVAFSDRMESLLATADGAVTMAGYNTVAELLSYQVPALMVPRVQPRLEQWLRATRLAAVAPFSPVTADELRVKDIESFVSGILGGPRAIDHQLDLEGARAAAKALVRLGDRALARAAG
jgi:predicted glycosyltransferase